MSPENAEVKRWLVKAQHDWAAVRKILTPDCKETDVAAFHCQQAVEKMLKAYLVSRAIQFEKVHDLGLILDQCATDDGDFESLQDRVEPLTIYAIAFRYPGPAEPSVQEVNAALLAVDQVWRFVTERLDRDMIP